MEAFKKAVLEIIRLAVFAGVSAFVASVTESITNMPTTTTTIVLLGALRFVDKYVHENKDIPFKGIVPF